MIMPVLLWTVPASAQRIQFPTAVAQADTGTTNTSPNLLTPPSSSTYQSPTATYPPSSTYTAPTSTYQSPNPYTQPSQGYTQPAQGYPQQTPGYGQTTPGYGQSAPGYVPQGSYNYTPPASPSQLPPAGSATAPGAAVGGVQAPGTWDPYAAPCPSSTPTPLLQQDPYFQYGQPAVPAMAMTKALQEIRLDYHWFAGHGVQELGINDVELNAKFAVPFYNIETPFLITPGFAVHYWEGPVSVDPNPVELPPRTYDAYLDAAWNPQVLPWLGGELSFRIGLYDDFVRKITTNSIRYTGTGLGVVSLSPNVKLKAGVMYLDRNYIKLLPSGGIVWTPNPDWYFNILFPNPKIGKRLTNTGGTEWWLYFSGDYGGGAWQITQQDPVTMNKYYNNFDYNDIRIAVGLEFKTYRNFTGLFEVGGAFSRELRYRDLGLPNYFPNNTVFLRGGLAY